MKTKQLTILGGVLLLLILMTLTMQYTREQSYVTPTKVLLSGKSTDMEEILVTKGELQKIVLKKEGAEWMMKEPVPYRANQEKVAELLKEMEGFTARETISTNPEKHSLFQVDKEQAVHIEGKKGGNTLLNVYLGKPAPNAQESYVRKEGSNDVYLVPGVYMSTFAQEARAFRDPSVLTLNKEEITRVTVKMGDSKWVREQGEGGMWKDASTGKELDTAKLTPFIGYVSSLKAEDFIDGDELQKSKEVEEKHDLKVYIELKSGTPRTLYLRKLEEGYYIKEEGLPQVYTVGKFVYETFMKDPKEEEKGEVATTPVE